MKEWKQGSRLKGQPNHLEVLCPLQLCYFCEHQSRARCTKKSATSRLCTADATAHATVCSGDRWNVVECTPLHFTALNCSLLLGFPLCSPVLSQLHDKASIAVNPDGGFEDFAAQVTRLLVLSARRTERLLHRSIATLRGPS